MKAYCINLDRSPDRLERMKTRMAELGVKFERIPAVDGLDPEVREAAKSCVIGVAGFVMGPGGYACFLSHRLAWQRLLDTEDRYAMIFEDDADIADGIADYLDDGWVPADADVVKTETFLTRFRIDRGPGIMAGPRRLHRVRSEHTGSAGYVISRRAAALLLERTSGVLSDPIDEVIFNENCPTFHELVIYQISPAPVIQGERRMARYGHESWAESTMVQRFSDSSTGNFLPRTFTNRLKKRLRTEVRALLTGTRSVVIDFG